MIVVPKTAFAWFCALCSCEDRLGDIPEEEEKLFEIACKNSVGIFSSLEELNESYENFLDNEFGIYQCPEKIYRSHCSAYDSCKECFKEACTNYYLSERRKFVFGFWAIK